MNKNKKNEIHIKRKSKINNNWIRGFDRIGSQKGRDGSRRKMILILVWLFWYVYIMEAYISIENSHTRTPHSATPAYIQYIATSKLQLYLYHYYEIYLLFCCDGGLFVSTLCVLVCWNVGCCTKIRQYKLNERCMVVFNLDCNRLFIS